MFKLFKTESVEEEFLCFDRSIGMFKNTTKNNLSLYYIKLTINKTKYLFGPEINTKYVSLYKKNECLYKKEYIDHLDYWDEMEKIFYMYHDLIDKDKKFINRCL